jgi:hypothetical protein
MYFYFELEIKIKKKMEDNPDEIYLQMFRHLNLDDYMAMKYTNKKFYNLLEDREILKTLKFNSNYKLLSKRVIQKAIDFGNESIYKYIKWNYEDLNIDLSKVNLFEFRVRNLDDLLFVQKFSDVNYAAKMRFVFFARKFEYFLNTNIEKITNKYIKEISKDYKKISKKINYQKEIEKYSDIISEYLQNPNEGMKIIFFFVNFLENCDVKEHEYNLYFCTISEYVTHENIYDLIKNEYSYGRYNVAKYETEIILSLIQYQ